jgi:two-component system OmpR family response regulator
MKSRAGLPLTLTATEYRLLEFLMRRAGHAVSRSAIIEGVWGFEEDVEANTVDAYIKHLREKIDAGREHKLIQTVRGYGYILREEP